MTADHFKQDDAGVRGKGKERKPGRPPGRARGESKAVLLAAARELVSERGLNKLTMKDVARRANVNSALAHYYFGNKQGLQEAITQLLIEQMAPVRESAADPGDPSREQLRAIIKAYAGRLLNDPSAARFALEHLLLSPNDQTQAFVKDYIKPGADYVESVYDQAVDEGALVENRFLFTLITMVGASLFYTIFVPAAGKQFGVKQDSRRLQEEFASFLSDLVTEGLSTNK